MSESERTRTRERGPKTENLYDRALRYYRENNERMETGQVVIRASEREIEVGRQET